MGLTGGEEAKHETQCTGGSPPPAVLLCGFAAPGGPQPRRRR
jgi:hypothetical protein